ncbi:hypothetical protein K1T71_009074 [Dendrolimus kikuchii]|uniref:Uncharacterized protein n=1 Tax=Dendrolimus kikuchii TaxID=765133 RepID=A0ACC1CTF3_9NEOP|nr:hypothetical protein K1T71_009074 [Dendrolimus kikuchii]
MNEGIPMMFHGSGGFGGPGVYMMSQLERAGHYPLDMLPVMGVGHNGGGTGRRWQHHRERPKDSVAFGYDSDDSSLSSNASGTTKSGEKGGGRGNGSERPNGAQRGEGGGYSREWRGRKHQRRFAPDRYLHTGYAFQVKYTPDDLLNGSKWDTLSQEIWDKFLKSQQTEETFKRKINLWRYLFITIKSIFPRYGLYVVGSTMSGFGLDSSDVDLCLFIRPDGHLEPRAHALLHLSHVLQYIKSFDPDAELIQAKVPIVKFRDTQHGLSVDLNCNNVVGIKNTSLLRCFAKSDWRVRPLVALAKLWARAHDINDARQRTLSSYSLTLMVLHFLQCGTHPAILPSAYSAGAWESRAANRTPLGELFLQMLKYYAEFPYERMAVSVRAGCRVPVGECRAARAHKNDPHQWKLLCVEEPFDLTNTARSVYDPDTFEKIVRTFRESYKRLSLGLRLADAWPQR